MSTAIGEALIDQLIADLELEGISGGLETALAVRFGEMYEAGPDFFRDNQLAAVLWAIPGSRSALEAQGVGTLLAAGAAVGEAKNIDDTVWVSDQTTYVGADHDTFPYSAVVYIESTFPSGITYRGSGAVVGENDVLTASHAVYSLPDGGLADEIRVYPGRDGASIPLGPYYGGYVNYFEVDPDGDGTLSQLDSEDDLAIIGFDMSFGTLTGWFGLDPDGPSGYYNATGYPGIYDDDTGPRMTNSHGLATKSDRYQIFNYDTIETNPGNSGGPLWYEYDTSPYLVGVSSTSGWAADIGSHYNSILDWIAGNDFLLDGSAGTAVSSDIAESTEVALVGVSDYHAAQALVDVA
jgi:V8-like Glu-specific endopeptidase